MKKFVRIVFISLFALVTMYGCDEPKFKKSNTLKNEDKSYQNEKTVKAQREIKNNAFQAALYSNYQTKPKYIPPGSNIKRASYNDEYSDKREKAILKQLGDNLLGTGYPHDSINELRKNKFIVNVLYDDDNYEIEYDGELSLTSSPGIKNLNSEMHHLYDHYRMEMAFYILKNHDKYKEFIKFKKKVEK